MASEFQRRKVRTVFDAMDADGNGVLERDDFVALTVRWTGVRNWPPASAEHRRLTAIMMGWWSTLEAAAGPERPGRVSLDDVLGVVDRLVRDPAPVAVTAAAMFEAVDENGDGGISPAEYRQLMETWTGHPVDAGETFRLLDRDGDGSVSLAEFTTAWQEFWTGDDPAEPGSWLFGRFEVPAA
jgi:Ca2+-binding EF-hand superfamily protein